MAIAPSYSLKKTGPRSPQLLRPGNKPGKRSSRATMIFDPPLRTWMVCDGGLVVVPVTGAAFFSVSKIDRRGRSPRSTCRVAVPPLHWPSWVPVSA